MRADLVEDGGEEEDVAGPLGFDGSPPPPEVLELIPDNR